MHEIGLVKNMISALGKEVDNEGIGNVKKIHIEVGSSFHELSPEVITNSFQHMDKHKKLEGASLEVKIVQGKELIIKKKKW